MWWGWLSVCEKRGEAVRLPAKHGPAVAAAVCRPARESGPVDSLGGLGVGDVGRQPVKALVEALAAGGAGALDVPVTLAQRMQAELVRDLGGVHGVWQILLIGKHEQHGLAQLVLAEHTVQLVLRLADAVAVIAVHHEDQALRVLEVVPPERANLVLTAHVPHGEADVLVLHSLHVEANGGDGSHDLAQLELVQDRGLTGGIKSDHKNAHLLLGEQLAQHLAEREPHGGERTVPEMARRQIRCGRGRQRRCCGAGGGGSGPV
mmetsp:Transcript_6020/g.15757  ORF Transcript_6020/g.15757 Transcript_6020/m.15757 type:complete len:262 (-) Transcript_6020:40-825(-)